MAPGGGDSRQGIRLNAWMVLGLAMEKGSPGSEMCPPSLLFFRAINVSRSFHAPLPFTSCVHAAGHPVRPLCADHRGQARRSGEGRAAAGVGQGVVLQHIYVAAGGMGLIWVRCSSSRLQLGRACSCCCQPSYWCAGTVRSAITSGILVTPARSRNSM